MAVMEVSQRNAEKRRLRRGFNAGDHFRKVAGFGESSSTGAPFRLAVAQTSVPSRGTRFRRCGVSGQPKTALRLLDGVSMGFGRTKRLAIERSDKLSHRVLSYPESD